MQSQAVVQTPSGEIYLKKLCRHFAHKVPAMLSGEQGIIDFPFGRCRIAVGPDHIRLSTDLNDAHQAASAEGIVTEHLVCMARREDLTVQWVRREQRPGSVAV